MPDNTFFEESREQSEVKAAIVAKYFDVWARIMLAVQKKTGRPNKIAYIDLFAGPGRYKSGTKSTPLLVLEKAIADAGLRSSLVTFFNDKDQKNVDDLKRAISELKGVETLAYSPQIMCHEVGEQIVARFEQMRLVPTLFFVDPWGYKGLSLRLVNSVIKDWGCDAVFFFNYNRINAGLGNEAVRQHMDALFERTRADKLRLQLEPLAPNERELVILEELSQALRAMGANYVLPFRFLNDQGSRTSHYLIFVSKAYRGYEKMKEVMATQASQEAQGVPQFQYAPADRRQPLLFDLSRPLEELGDMLLVEFAGQTRTLQQIYDAHNVGRPFIKKNYKQVLCDLECAGKVKTDPPSGKRRRGFADTVLVTFPSRSS